MDKKTEIYKKTGADITGDGGSKGGSRWRNLKTFESFKIPAYRIYFGAMAGQWATMSMQMVVRPLLAYRISGSGMVLGGAFPGECHSATDILPLWRCHRR